MKTILAIDPGFVGGLALVRGKNSNESRLLDVEVLEKMPMPLTGDGKGKTIDVNAIRRFAYPLIKNDKVDNTLDVCDENVFRVMPDEVWIEKVGAMPGQGVTSMFTFGYNAGMLEGMFLALGIPVFFVRPQQWQKVLSGYSSQGKASTVFCSRMFPHIDWRASDRCRTPHNGMTDATCIGVWALQQ